MSDCPLSQKLQHILEPVTFTVEMLGDTPTMMEPGPSPFKESKTPIDVQARYIDGFNRRQTSFWAATDIQLARDTIWFDSRVGQSRQWAELHAVWIVAKNEAVPPCYLYR